MKRKIRLSLLWLFLGGLIWDNLRIVTSSYEIEKICLPKAFDGFRLVQVSDYHNASYKKASLKRVKALSPDIIVLTGDLIDSRKRDIEDGLAYASKLCALAPCYYVTGNHEKRLSKNDYAFFIKRLKALGIIVLEDEGTFIEKNGEVLYLVGLTDLGTWQRQKTALSLTKERLKSLVCKKGFYLLLAHRPELFEAYAEAGISLALTGHAHGGQVRLFNRGLFAPHQGFFPKYTSGLYQKEGLSMVVSRGLGRSLLPLRLNNPPELVEVTLKVKEV